MSKGYSKDVLFITRAIAWAAVCIVFALSVLALLGWVFDMPHLKGFGAYWTPMSVLTALCLFLCASESALLLMTPSGVRKTMVLKMPGIIVALLSLSIIAIYALVTVTGYVPALLSYVSAPVNRIPFLTAFLLLFSGCALILLATGDDRLAGYAHALTLPVAILSYVVPVSYMLGFQDLLAWLNMPMALTTGIAFCALSIALFCIRPDTWLMQVLTGELAGSRMARRLLPALLVIPLLIGWLELQDDLIGIVRLRSSPVIGAVIYTVCLLWLLWVSARSVNRSEEDKKASEEALRESEEKFRGLAESMQQLVWIADAQSRSIYLNPSFIEYTGLHEVTTEQLLQLIHPEDRAAIRDIWQEELSSGYTIQHMLRIRRQDGVYRWFHTRLMVRRDDERQLVWAFGTALDVDDLIQTEQALKESLHMLATAERIGNMGSWRRDLATEAITYSAGSYRIMGFPDDSTITFEAFASHIHPDDRDSLMKRLRETLEKGTSFTEEFRIMLPDGTIRHLEGRGEAKLDAAGKPAVLHGAILDITERKRLEEGLFKAQKLESIGTLAGGIAHDFNNLLAAILGYIDLAKLKITQPDEAQAFLTKAEHSAQAAGDLTRQILTFSEGSQPIQRSLHIRDILAPSVGLALSGSKTKTQWKIADDLPEVKVDENQIRQVIHNIALNAQEAMPQGGTLSVEVDKVFLAPDNPVSLPEGMYVRMAFRDEGHGILAENLPKVFDPYFTTKDLGNKKGMGLGLSICYAIIKRHKGHITVESKIGLGTEVVVYLPGIATQAKDHAGPYDQYLQASFLKGR